MNSLIRIMSAETSRMDDGSYLVTVNPPPTACEHGGCCRSRSAHSDDVSMATVAVEEARVLASPFATVAFVREDCQVGERGYHVATMRVPLAAADVTVRQLAKEAMRRLASVLRRQDGGRAPGGSQGKAPVAGCPFVGVAQVLVEHKGDMAKLHAVSPRVEGGEDRSRCTSGAVTSLPPSEIFSNDLVRQVVALREEVVVMRLRASEGNTETNTVHRNSPGADGKEKATPAPEQERQVKRPRSAGSAGEDDTSDGSDEEEEEEGPTARQRPVTVDDADVEMVARELRARGRNRLGWGPDAHKNFDSNYVPSPQKLMARPRRCPRRRRTHEGTEGGGEGWRRRRRREEPPARTEAAQTCSTPVLQARGSSPASTVAGADAGMHRQRASSPVDDDLPPPTTAKVLLPSLDISKSFHDPVDTAKPTAASRSVAPPLSFLDPTAPVVPQSSATPEAVRLRTRQEEEGMGALLLPSHHNHPCHYEHTPPQQTTARCLQWEETSGSRTNGKPQLSQLRPMAQPVVGQAAPSTIGGDQPSSDGFSLYEEPQQPPTPPLPPQQLHTQLGLTPSSQGRATKNGSSSPLRAMTTAATPDTVTRALFTTEEDAPKPLPKGWGGEAANYFDPETYCDNPKHANITQRSPVRARRQVQLPAYFSLLDTRLSDRAILHKLSQMK